MAAFAAAAHGVPEDRDRCSATTGSSSATRASRFGELAQALHRRRASSSRRPGSTRRRRSPGIAPRARGRPFFYFAYGAACAEVVIDTLTGENRVPRVDILHDVGRSLNPAIDIGQIEGGFVQGMGWLTTEELVFDADRAGCSRTRRRPTRSRSPPTCRRISASRSIRTRNREDTIYRSKAVGEPPLMLAISVFCAIADAIHALAPVGRCRSTRRRRRRRSCAPARRCAGGAMP